MKKFIILIALAIAGFSFSGTYAQKLITPNPLATDVYLVDYTGLASDTVGVGNTTWGYVQLLNKSDGLYYNAKVKVSDVTAGAACTVKLQGKYFDDDAFADITTYTWYGGGTDTTLVFTSNTNKVYYRYLKVLVSRTASKLKVNSVKISLKK